MSERYRPDLAHERMAEGRCPECGELPGQHLDSPAFWLPRRCDLMPRGVVDRIEQYRTDLAEAQS